MDDCPGGGYSENQGTLSYALGAILQVIFDFLFGQSTAAAPVSQANYAEQEQLGHQLGGSSQMIGLHDGTNVYSHGGGADRLANILFRETSVLSGEEVDTARIAVVMPSSRAAELPILQSMSPTRG